MENCAKESPGKGHRSGTLTVKKRKPWMKEEILQIMEQRRLNKRKMPEYNRLHKLGRSEIWRAKEKWLNEKCEEIKKVQEQHDSFNMHKMIKEMTGKQRS